jgi:hypothetical protein
MIFKTHPTKNLAKKMGVLTTNTDSLCKNINQNIGFQEKCQFLPGTGTNRRK